MVVLTVCSCGQDENKLAQRFLDSATTAFQNGDFASSKLMIDSVRIVYPKAFEARKAGIRLLQKVEIAEAERTVAFQDSALVRLREKFEMEKSRFVFEKDEKYQDLGIYYISSQSPEKNVNRNYLKAQADEKGRMTLISNFSGSSFIHHRSLNLVSGDSYVDTPLSDDFHEFEDLGVCYEKCNFAAGNDGEAAAFIAMNVSGRIDVTLNGAERKVSYRMTDADKKAVKDVYSFSLLLSSIEEAVSLREEALRKIEFVNANIAKSDTLQ